MADDDEAELIQALQRDICPDCGSQAGFEPGPRGAAAQNIFCNNCGEGFNVALPRSIMFAQRIGKRPQ